MTDTTEFSAASNKTDNGLVTQTSRLLANFQRFTSQPSFQRSFPAVIAVIAVAIGLLVYAILQQPERTTLYASLAMSDIIFAKPVISTLYIPCSNSSLISSMSLPNCR